MPADLSCTDLQAGTPLLETKAGPASMSVTSAWATYSAFRRSSPSVRPDPRCVGNGLTLQVDADCAPRLVSTQGMSSVIRHSSIVTVTERLSDGDGSGRPPGGCHGGPSSNVGRAAAAEEDDARRLTRRYVVGVVVRRRRYPTETYSVSSGRWSGWSSVCRVGLEARKPRCRRGFLSGQAGIVAGIEA